MDPSVLIWRAAEEASALTLKLLKLLVQAGLDEALQLAQGGRLQHLEVDLDLVRVGVAHRRLPGLDDVHHAGQLGARQPVDVQAQLVLLVVRHRQRLLVRVAVFVFLPQVPEGQHKAVEVTMERTHDVNKALRKCTVSNLELECEALLECALPLFPLPSFSLFLSVLFFGLIPGASEKTASWS